LAKKSKAKDANPVLANNRKAGHEFHLLERYEAGIVLLGPEVKSARQGRVSLKEAYAKIRNGEVFLLDAHFSPYTHAAHLELDPVRPRKLLLNAREIRKLAKALDGSGTTLVPTRMYLKNGRIKVEIAVAKGKKQHDKRDSLKRKQAERDIKRALGSRELRD
jgi:SsrA-binding protein